MPKQPRLAPPAPEAAYEVGYRRPPLGHRFAKGKSGNPKGRPRGVKRKPPALNEERLKDIIVAEAYRTIRVTPAAIPLEDEPPLLVDADRMEAFKIAAQLFEVITGILIMSALEKSGPAFLVPGRANRDSYEAFAVCSDLSPFGNKPPHCAFENAALRV